MNSENIKSSTNQAIEQLIEALNGGKSAGLTNYLAAVAKLHRYSFQNILPIARQCPQAFRSDCRIFGNCFFENISRTST